MTVDKHKCVGPRQQGRVPTQVWGSKTKNGQHACVVMLSDNRCAPVVCVLLQGVGWARCGSNVQYGANNIMCRRQSYYTLTFTVELPHDGDLVHLAHCYPLTWTQQQQHLDVLTKVAGSHVPSQGPASSLRRRN